MKVVFKIFGALFAIAFCIVLLAIQIGTHVAFFGSSIVSEKGINRIIKDIDVTLLLEDSDGNKTSIYNQVADLTSEIGLKEEATERILKSDGVANILSSVISSAADYYILEKTDILMSTEKANQLLDENIDSILVASGMNISTKEKEILLKEAKKELPKLLEEVPTRDSLVNSKDMEIIKFALSIDFKLILFGAILGLTLMIALVKWSIRKAIRDNGIVTIIVSVIMLTTGLGVGYVFATIARTLPQITDYISVLSPVLRVFGNMFLIQGGIALLIGILFVVVNRVIKKNQSEKDEEVALKAL